MLSREKQIELCFQDALNLTEQGSKWKDKVEIAVNQFAP